jgi:DNA processing protein
MTEAHWFSNICPYFNVHQLELYNATFGNDSSVEISQLAHLQYFDAANWLSLREGIWKEQKKNIPRWLAKADKDVYKILFWGDSQFPKNLATLSFPPSLLFYKGIISDREDAYVSIVGARSPTEIGRLWVQRAVAELSEVEGIVIVSGGARGIDAEAHWSAIEGGRRTLAFLPGSVDSPYPRSNNEIFEKIVENGALLSEYPPKTEVRRENFHRRNRLIAGIADVVVIVEAAEKSGTIMTAGKALAENREILVVPGPPLVASYAGSLNLIYNGAPLARDSKDIILSLVRKNVLKLKEETPTLWQ